MTPTPAFVFREFSAEHSIRSAFTQKRRVTGLFEHKRWKFGSNFFEKILAKKPTIKVGGQHAPQQRTRRLPFYFIHLRLVSLIYWHQENLRKMKKKWDLTREKRAAQWPRFWLSQPPPFLYFHKINKNDYNAQQREDNFQLPVVSHCLVKRVRFLFSSSQKKNRSNFVSS